MNEELRVIITAEIADLKKQIEVAQSEIKSLSEGGSKNMNKFTAAAKGVGKGVMVGLSVVGTAVAAAGAALVGLAAGTKEYQVAQAKLKTAFEAAGSSADVAKSVYNDLYRVLGDDQQAVEAANHLAQMTTNQQELEQWTKITQGVYATFGDSLPIESLTEAANETAKTGELTGALADALNWAGIAEEDFQAQLLMCNDEAEREALIRTTLNGIYSEAAEGYEKNAAAILAENEAQAKLTEAMATMGAVALPIMTMFKTMLADVLTELAPFVEMMANGLKGALEGTAGASQVFAEGLSGALDTILTMITNALPTVIQIVADLFESLLVVIVSALPNVITTVLNGVSQLIIALSEMLPDIVTLVVEVIPLIINSIVDAVPNLLSAAITFLMAIVDAIPVLITGLLQALPSVLSTIISTLLNAIPTLTQAAIQLLNSLIVAIPTIINALIEELPNIIETIITSIVEALPDVLDAAITLLMAIVDAIPVIIKTLVPLVPEIILTIIDVLLDNIDLLIDCAIDVFMTLVEAIPVIIQELTRELPSIINTITNSLIKNTPKILQGAITLFGSIVKAIPKMLPQLVKTIPTIIKSIVNGLKDGISSVTSIGKDLIKGLWNGIKDMTSWIGEKIKGFGKNVLDKLKNFFGIASPSKVMENIVGKNLALGIGEGFMDTITDVNKEIIKSMEPLTEARTFSIDGEVAAPTPIVTSRTPMKPINTENTSVDKLAGTIASQKGTIVLKIDKKVLGEVTVEGINDITKQTGVIPLVIA